jgi:hypothetical protein
MGAFEFEDDEVKLSLDSSRLCFKASNKSTRSLHWSSSWRNESMSALSVSDEGR